jgi:Domain of unknown function (DUF4416)
MASGKPREEALLFAGCLFSSQDIYEAARAALRKDLGNILLETPPLPWKHSDYYAEELGSPLFRTFIFFNTVIDTSVLPDIKLTVMHMEKEFSKGGKRRINIDPGYLSLAKVVLSSRKNYSHRIYLGKLVFAELELIFKEGSFHPLPYTYTDYRDEANIRTFQKARRLLKEIIDK